VDAASLKKFQKELDDKNKELERLEVKVAIKDELVDDLSDQLTQKESEYLEYKNHSEH
jgi:uncharacterized coiled-coil protein SlyX